MSSKPRDAGSESLNCSDQGSHPTSRQTDLKWRLTFPGPKSSLGDIILTLGESLVFSWWYSRGQAQQCWSNKQCQGGTRFLLAELSSSPLQHLLIPKQGLLYPLFL